MSTPPAYSSTIPFVPSDFATSRAIVADHILPFVISDPRSDDLKQQVVAALELQFGSDSRAEFKFWRDKIVEPLEITDLPIDFDSETYKGYHIYFRHVLHSQSLDFMDDPDVKIQFWTLTGTWRKSARAKSVSRQGSTGGGEEGQNQEGQAVSSDNEREGEEEEEELDYGDDEAELELDPEPEVDTPRAARRGTSIEIIDQLVPKPISRPPPLPPVASGSSIPFASRLGSPPKVASTSRTSMPTAFAPGGSFAPPRQSVPTGQPLSSRESEWETDNDAPSKGKGTRRSTHAATRVGHPFPSDPAPLPPPPALSSLQKGSGGGPAPFANITREELWNQLGLVDAPRASASATIAESAAMQAHFADVESTFNTPVVPRYDLTVEEVKTRQKQERFREAKLLPKAHPYNTYRVAAKCLQPIDPLDCLKILCGEFIDYEDIRDYSPTGIINSPEDLQDFAIGAAAAARSKRTKEGLTDYYQFARVRATVNSYIRIHFPWRDVELAKWERWMDDRALGASPDYILCLIAYERHARLEQERIDGRVASFSGAGDGSSLYVDFCISWNRDFHSAATPKARNRSPRTSDGHSSPTKKIRKKREKVDEPCRRWNSGDNHPDDSCKFYHLCAKSWPSCKKKHREVDHGKGAVGSSSAPTAATSVSQ